MTGPDSAAGPVPVVHRGVLLAAGAGALSAAVAAPPGTPPVPAGLQPLGPGGRWLLDPVPEGDFVLHLARDGRALPGGPLAIQRGGFDGRVDWLLGGLAAGRAVNLRRPGADAVVVAFDSAGALAFATARAADGHRFVMALPPPPETGPPRMLSFGIAGSDHLLAGAPRAYGGPLPPVAATAGRPSIRIKIATPNLREAPLWGDFHFANSLRAGFERLGFPCAIDTADVWYAQPAQEDVVLVLRGRQPVTLDPGRINILWVISHPDRLDSAEYESYDHVAVASDPQARALAGRNLGSSGVLHQATDAQLFGALPETDAAARLPACLFVGNSRREYRTMVKWCLQRNLPLDLYGGGWDGVLPPGLPRGPGIANADLPGLYARHLILLNDHWDAMRNGGFLSNRLFDGSAIGTPIITDPVAGLEAVFGDTIASAADIDAFAALVRDCLADPAPYLARAGRARAIVRAAHTFDHRARQLGDLIDLLAARKGRGF